MSTFKTPKRRKRDARRRQAQEARWAERRPRDELTDSPEPDSQAAVARERARRQDDARGGTL